MKICIPCAKHFTVGGDHTFETTCYSVNTVLIWAKFFELMIFPCVIPPRGLAG